MYLFKSNYMGKAIIEFTFKGRKKTYLRRIDAFGEPLTTTNVNSAKKLKENNVKDTLKLLITKLGKDNIKDINVIKDEE